MKFCIPTNEMQPRGGCYLEFQKGKFDGHNWIENSLCLDDDIFEELKLYYLFSKILPNFDHWGPNELTIEQWRQIKIEAEKIGGDIYTAVSEIDFWVNTVLPNETVISILGI